MSIHGVIIEADDADVAALVAATKAACAMTDEANAAIASRDEALDHLVELLGGGDHLAAISNAQRRIGVLMVGQEESR